MRHAASGKMGSERSVAANVLHAGFGEGHVRAQERPLIQCAPMAAIQKSKRAKLSRLRPQILHLAERKGLQKNHASGLGDMVKSIKSMC